MSGPLVTVVIPSRNRPALAARAVASALGQTYAPLEVLVGDDASSPALALAPDERLRVVRFDRHLGAAAVRNSLVADARGELIAFLDDDDTWSPAKLERQVPLADRAAAVETGYELWDGDRLRFRYMPLPDRDMRTTTLERPCLQPSTVVIWKSVFQELGGFDVSLGRLEDWEFAIRLAQRHHVAVLPEVQVRRLANPALPVRTALAAYAILSARVEPLVRRLPERDRDRVRAAHGCQHALLLALAGERRRGAAVALRTWSRHPRSVRAVSYAGRAAAGERAWRAALSVYEPLRVAHARARGRDPLVRRW